MIWSGDRGWGGGIIIQEDSLWPLPSHCPEPGRASLSTATGSTAILGLCSGWQHTRLTRSLSSVPAEAAAQQLCYPLGTIREL